MKLYVREQVFTWKDKFTIKDEKGKDAYYVEGELFSLGHKLHIYNDKEKEVAFVKEKTRDLSDKVDVYVKDELITTVTKETSFSTTKYSLLNLDWEIEGDYGDREYTITEDGDDIIRINKAWLMWKDSYEIEIANDEDAEIAIGIVLAINCILAKQRNQSNFQQQMNNNHNHNNML